MEIIRKEGYIIDPKKVNNILNKKAVKDYLESLAQLDNRLSDDTASHDDKLKIMRLSEELTAAENALLSIERRECPGMRHHTYIISLTGEISMVSALMSVVGNTDYNNIKLDKPKEQFLQQQWRDIGIEPTLIEWQKEESPSIIGTKNQELLTVAENILKAENFYYSYCYWSLKQNVVDYKFTEFAPGIDMGVDRDNGKFWLRAVVNCDVFARQVIYIDNEELLRSVLCSMIMYIKDWHDNFQEL